MQSNNLFLKNHILAFAIAIILLLLIANVFDLKKIFLPDYPVKHNCKIPSKERFYYPNFKESINAELDLRCALKNKSIIVFGSSELSQTAFSSIPYRFINDSLHYPFYAFGEAGNQSLAILSEMMSNQKYLKDSKVLIIVSPSWFITEYYQGTSLKVFFENNNERTLNSIYFNNNIKIEHKKYLYNYIKKNYADINSPPAVTSLMSLESYSDKNFFFKIINYPFMKLNEFLAYQKLMFSDLLYSLGYINKTININQYDKLIPEVKIEYKNKTFDWDYLYKSSIEEHKKNSTNNNWGIYNDYYSQYVKGRQSRLKFENEKINQELKDFMQLMKFIKDSEINASFIMQPLNPYRYTNLKDFYPLKSKIDSAINLGKYPYLDLYVADTNKYQIGLLSDIMHLGNYGWYQVDRFIINTYIQNGKN